MRIHHRTERQAAIRAQTEAVGLHNSRGQGLQARAKQVERVLPGACPGADGERVGGMRFRRGDVAPEVGQAALQPAEGLRQFAEGAPGQILLVGMMLFQDGEALEFGRPRRG